MRSPAPALLPLFRSRAQAELLALLLADPDREWTLQELSEHSQTPYPTVATEIRRLARSSLIKSRSVGRTKVVCPNQMSPYLAPLTQLVLMSFGPPLIIAEEFAGVEGIEQLSIFGSWAKRYHGNQGPTPGDIDLLVIGTPDRDQIYEAARRAEQRLGTEVNTTIRTLEQWTDADDGFTREVKQSPIVSIR